MKIRGMKKLMFFFSEVVLKTTSAPSFNKTWRCENSLCAWKTAAKVPGPMERRFWKTAGRLGAKLLVFYTAFNGEIYGDSKNQGRHWLDEVLGVPIEGPSFAQLDATIQKTIRWTPSRRRRAVEHHQFSEFSEKAMIWHTFSTTLKIHPNPNTRDDLSPYPMALWPCTTLTTVSRWILSPSRRTKIPPSSNLPAPRVKKKAEKFGIRFVFDETNISRSFASE